MVIPFQISVEHGEICLFPIGFVAPCHDWTEDDVAQGFCWHETQIAFLTLQYEGIIEVTVEIENELELRPDAIRTIQVPFFIREDSAISIWPVSAMWYSIPEGEYCLVYQIGLKPFISEERKKLGDFTPEWDDMWCVFTFIRQDNVEAKILRQDDKLNPPTPLFTRQRSPKPFILRSAPPE